MIKLKHCICLSLILFLPVNVNAQLLKPCTPFKYSTSENFSAVANKQLQEEIKELITLQKTIENADYQNIKHWNASYPSYRWHQEIMKASDRHSGHKNGGRVAIMHLAIYDAVVAVEKYNNSNTLELDAPFMVNTQIRKLTRSSDEISLVCDYSAAAAAAHEIILHYFPAQKDLLNQTFQEFKKARLLSGVRYPSGIELGIKIGRHIAAKYTEYAKTDQTDQEWNGKVSTSDTLWTGNPGKWDPMKGQWKPLTLEKPDQFRPDPPPIDWSSEMEELRAFNASHKSSDIAWKWKNAPVWDKLLEEQILSYDLASLEAAFASAMFHVARFDAIIAAWEAKYHYRGIRPFQYDPDFQPILIETPNFPGYPAGHSTVAGSLATVLAQLFPKEKELFQKLAIECAESRFEGGVHFRSDNKVGLEVGEKVGEQVLKEFERNCTIANSTE